jgi:ABC-type amino acid transport substrate-binding protein
MKKLSMNKKLFALALCAVMMLSVFVGCSSETATTDTETTTTTEETAQPTEAVETTESEQTAEPTEATTTLLEQIKANGKIVVGTEAQYAPYEFKDLDANFVGCDMWLAQQIADSLGVELEIVDMSFSGIIPAVQSGQVDLGIAAFTNTPERAEEIDFSDLYETSAQLLIVKAGNADLYSTKESLAGLKVGAQKGTIQSQLIQSALPDSELFELEKYPALALEVQNGNIAGLVVDQAVGESLVATSEGGLEVSNFQFSAEEASFGKSVVIAKGNEDLVAAVNEIIAKVTSDGSYQAAYDEAVELAASLGL